MIETPAANPTPVPGTAQSNAPSNLPPLAPPPERTAGQRRAERVAFEALRLLNGRFMVPMLRAGLGPWVGSPFGGWILLLRVRGRRTGLAREIPLSYLVAEGAAWVMAGFGPETQWYRNLLSDPAVEVVLPGGPRRCVARDERDPATRARIIPQLVRATGVPGYMSGCDPFRSTPDRVLEVTSWVPLLRLEPVGEPLVAGPDDPGGRAWIWRQAVVLGLTAWVVRRVTGRIARLRGC